MPTLNDIQFLPYQPEFGWALVALWRDAFQRAMGLPKENPLAAVDDQLRYWMTVPASQVTIAMDSKRSELGGFMVLADSEIDHLYLATDYQRLGLGSAFIQRAKAQSPKGLALYTFQANIGAQQFYLAQGFQEIRRGAASTEDNPWCTDPSQLADIRYTWQPDSLQASP